MNDNDKITVGNSLKDAIGKVELDPCADSAPPRLMMLGGIFHRTALVAEEADDITYALRADRHLMPSSADFDMDAFPVIPARTLPGAGADYDGNVAYPRSKRKTNVSHQRHGYSRRKAKQRHQARYAGRVGGLLHFEDPHYSISHSLINATRPRHSFDFLFGPDLRNEPQFQGNTLRTVVAQPGVTEAGSFTQPTKPTPHGKGDING